MVYTKLLEIKIFTRLFDFSVAERAWQNQLIPAGITEV
jgi:hypothetical protein